VVDLFYHSNVINGFAAANPNNTRILVQSDGSVFRRMIIQYRNLLTIAVGARTGLPMKRCAMCGRRSGSLSPVFGMTFTVLCPALSLLSGL
jgi:hypothetical protein